MELHGAIRQYMSLIDDIIYDSEPEEHERKRRSKEILDAALLDTFENNRLTGEGFSCSLYKVMPDDMR